MTTHPFGEHTKARLPLQFPITRPLDVMPMEIDPEPLQTDKMFCSQVGCFRVNRTNTADEELDPRRHESIVEEEIKVYIMTNQPLSEDEVALKAETLCLVRGFQSYCVYELDHSAFPEDESGFYNWIVEVYVQSFFKDSILEELYESGHFKDWELVVHQDAVKFSL
jgi:hypothetical protein